MTEETAKLTNEIIIGYEKFIILREKWRLQTKNIGAVKMVKYRRKYSIKDGLIQRKTM